MIEINPAKNGGEAHHFNQVVRNKNERKKLVADTCDGCAAVRSSSYSRSFSQSLT